MQYEDRLTIDTPEGVAIEITLAGLGSRIGAAMIDGLIQGVVIIALFIILALNGGFEDITSNDALLITAAITQVIAFAVLFFYYAVLEILWSGRSVGKRAFGLRVIDSSGGPVGVRASMTRNLLRIIDVLPFAYLIGTIAIISNKRNQRLGDLVGGTMVVRDETRVEGAARFTTSRQPRGWDVAGVTDEDLIVVRSLLARWEEIAPAARERLATDVKDRVSKKIGGEDRSLPAYDFLLQVIAETGAQRDK
jgi:uncharacterized RDD family membrane protein YckC